MKKVVNLLCMTLLLVSCSNDDDNEQTNTIDGEDLRSSLTIGEWRISNYLDDDQDRTGDYAGFVFTFNPDGTLAVTDQSTSLSGAWSISDIESDDDVMENDLDLNIFFASPDLFEELTEDWDVLDMTATSIELMDDDGGVTDRLTFEKI